MALLLDDRAPAEGEIRVEVPDVPAPPDQFSLWELAPVGILAVVVPFVFFGMWPLDRPVVYTQDLFQHLALARTADWTGTPGTTGTLAAPHGIDWQRSLPTGTERLHVLVIRAFDWLTGDVFTAMNLTVLLGVASTIVVSYLVIRWLGATKVVAAGAAVAFAMSPGLTERLAAGHLFLFALYPVALGVYLAVLGSRPWTGAGWRSLVVPGAAVVVVATSSVYYATFSVILIVVLGTAVAVRSADWRRLRVTASIVGAVVATMGLTLAPDLLARRGSSTAGAFTRSVVDNYRYGLRLTQLLMPLPDSRVPLLGRLGERAYWTDGIGEYGASIGLLGVVGLLVVGWVVMRQLGRERDVTDRGLDRLALVIVAAVGFATVGGLGFLLATLGFTQTRVWSRMAAFVGFSAIAGLAMVVSRRWRTHPRVGLWVCAIVALSLIEHPLLPGRSGVDAMFREDRSTVASLERDLPRGAMVAELPAVPFPDDLGSDRLLAPSLHAGDALRFSAGAFKGGPGDWQQGWFAGDVGSSATAAAAAGFDALLLQRSHALIADGDGSVARMEQATGEHAWQSSGGTWAWVDLRPLRRRMAAELPAAAFAELRAGITRPVGVTYDDWRAATLRDGEAIQLLGPDGSIRLHPLDGDRSPVTLSFEVGAAQGADVTVSVGGKTVRRVRPGPDGRRVTLRLDDLGVDTSVRVRSSGADQRFDRATPAPVWVGGVQVRDTRAQELFGQLR